MTRRNLHPPIARGALLRQRREAAFGSLRFARKSFPESRKALPEGQIIIPESPIGLPEGKKAFPESLARIPECEKVIPESGIAPSESLFCLPLMKFSSTE